MRRTWMVLAIISYTVTLTVSLPVAENENAPQPKPSNDNTTDNSKVAAVKSTASPAVLNSSDSDKDVKADEATKTASEDTLKIENVKQDNSLNTPASSSSKEVVQKAASDQLDVNQKNDSAQSNGQINDPEVPPETPADDDTPNENEQGSGSSVDDETAPSEDVDNPSADKNEGNDATAESESETSGSGSSGIKSPGGDQKDNSNPTDGNKGDGTVDEPGKQASSVQNHVTTPSTGGNKDNGKEESAPKEQGASDNAADNDVDDSQSSKLPSDDKKSSVVPVQVDEKGITIPADRGEVSISQTSFQKQDVNPADGDDFETYYQDDSKSSMDGSAVQSGPSYDDVDIEEPVRGGADQQQYEDDKQTFISSGGQNQKIGGQFTDDEDSHFFAYFLTIMVTAIIFYLVFHNKQRIIALIIEGRAPRNGRSRRSSSKAKYHKLDNNLEEAITATKGSKYDGLY